jgi:hypothetical protein
MFPFSLNLNKEESPGNTLRKKFSLSQEERLHLKWGSSIMDFLPFTTVKNEFLSIKSPSLYYFLPHHGYNWLTQIFNIPCLKGAIFTWEHLNLCTMMLDNRANCKTTNASMTCLKINFFLDKINLHLIHYYLELRMPVWQRGCCRAERGKLINKLWPCNEYFNRGIDNLLWEKRGVINWK